MEMNLLPGIKAEPFSLVHKCLMAHENIFFETGSISTLTSYVNSTYFSQQLCISTYLSGYPELKQIIQAKKASDFTTPGTSESLVALLLDRTCLLQHFNRIFSFPDIKVSYVYFMYMNLVDLRANIIQEDFIDPAEVELEFFMENNILFYPPEVLSSLPRDYRDQRISYGLLTSSYECIPSSERYLSEISACFAQRRVDSNLIYNLVRRIAQEAIRQDEILPYEGLIHLVTLFNLEKRPNPLARLHPKRKDHYCPEYFANWKDKLILTLMGERTEYLFRLQLI